MTEPDEPQLQVISIFAIPVIIVLLLLMVGLQRAFEHGVRDRVAQVQWTDAWDHLEKQRKADEKILTSGECQPDSEVCRIPIAEAMDYIVQNPSRIKPWAPAPQAVAPPAPKGAEPPAPQGAEPPAPQGAEP